MLYVHMVMFCDWIMYCTILHYTCSVDHTTCCHPQSTHDLNHDRYFFTLGMKHVSCRNAKGVILHEGPFLDDDFKRILDYC